MTTAGDHIKKFLSSQNEFKTKYFLSPDSPYRQQINRAILSLKERNEIKAMHNKWWLEKVNDTNGELIDCEAIAEALKDDATLGMNNVGGVFIVLVVGIIISLFFGLLEFLWAVRQTSIDFKVTCEVFCFFCLKSNLKFAKNHLIRIDFICIVANTNGGL